MFGTVSFRPTRSIGGFEADVTIEEQHTDSSTITDHPVERGAAVSDHIYRNPDQLTVVAGWSNSSPAAGFDPTYVQRVYEKMRALKESGRPFDVYTGKRRYRNMLIQSLATTTGRETENVLILTVTMREIIIVETQTTQVPPSEDQAEPQKTQEVSEGGAKQVAPAPKANTSALATVFGG